MKRVTRDAKTILLIEDLSINLLKYSNCFKKSFLIVSNRLTNKIKKDCFFHNARSKE